MGFLNNILEQIKSKINRNKIKRLDAGHNNYEEYRDGEFLSQPYSIQISNSNEYAMITSIRFEDQIRHRDGTITDLMLAKTLIGRAGETFNQNDFVAFEVPSGLKINESILQKIIVHYLNERNMPKDQECRYIGILNENPKDYEINKSDNVNQYVRNQISSRIQAEKENKQKQSNESTSKAEQALKEEREQLSERIKYDVSEKKKEQMKEREERIKNSYLINIQNNNENGENSYEEYEGININNGDILKLRKVDKVAKDRNGMYIYTCYLQHKSNRSDVENLSQGGLPICFATDKKIEDIVDSNDQQEINSLLSLLSQESNFKASNGQLNYIGSKDKKPISTEVKYKIEELKQKFNIQQKEER